MPGGVLASAALALVAVCGSGQAAPRPSTSHGGHSASAAASSPAGPATRLASYPVRIGANRLVDKAERPVSSATKDRKVPQSFSFAATARDGYYLPGHQAHQDVYLIAGRLAPGVSPATEIGEYLGQFSGQEAHLTSEPAGPLGGAVKCWVAGASRSGWADNGTYGILDYRPPLGLDTALIHHLASLVPRFRQAAERPQA